MEQALEIVLQVGEVVATEQGGLRETVGEGLHQGQGNLEPTAAMAPTGLAGSWAGTGVREEALGQLL